MSYKLVCIDMDGTLLNDSNEISKENEISLKKCIDKGIEVAITTGRLYGSALEYSRKHNINCHIISCNGTFIKLKNDELIYASSFTIEQLKLISSLIIKHNLKGFYNTDFDVIIEEKNSSTKGENLELKKTTKLNYINTSNILDVLNKLKNPIYRVSIIDDTITDNLLSVREALLKTGEFEVVNSMPNNIDIAPKGNSKGSGVLKLSNVLNIEMKDIICIGDRENDISMIKSAGLGIAMDNAVSELKDNSDYITKSNNHSGVSYALNKFILT
ncbi:MAG: Cof-type HAD-IIB family hydrolase [Clostridium sp.]